MATRHLRRLQEQLQNQPTLAPASDVEESEEEEDQNVQGKPFNPFDLLSDDDNQQPAEDTEDDDADQAEAPSRPEPQQRQVQATNTSVGGKKKSGNKKKRKGKAGAKEPEDTKAGTGADAERQARDEEDIDKLVKELKLETVGVLADASSRASAGKAAASTAHILAVDVKGLRGDDELRRIFGADVVQSVDRADAAEAADRRRRTNQVRGMPVRRRPLKRGLLVSPKEHWPPLDTGLSMQYVGMVEGRQQFRYVYSSAYRSTQMYFEQCQASFDPNNIARLLQQAPYHIDSLLAMYDLYRHMGENSYAEEVLERALYALEMAWHPSFNIATADCRLDYGTEENRGMFMALFRHIQALSRRGCHRTALECCKLLLALEPEDPMGALCLVDYLALRAGSFAFLQRFVSEFEGNRSLGLLPNYAMALPLSAFRLQQQQQQQGEGEASTSGQQGAASTGSDAVNASNIPPPEMLTQAILLHPVVLPQLVSRLQDKGVAKDSSWSSLLGRKLYAKATDHGNASLGHLVSIYCERSHLLWKAPDALDFLKQAATRAADIADGKVSAPLTAEDWAVVARESFPPDAESNEYRHLRLHDFSDNVAALPREEMQAAMAAGGMDEVEAALAEVQEQMVLAQQQAAARGQQQAPAMTEEEMRNANPLMMLLQSMMPWVNVGQQPDYEEDEGGPRGQPQG